MIQGSSQRVAVRVRILLIALMPLAVAIGLMLLGARGAGATQILAHGPVTLYGGPGDAFSALATLAGGAKIEILWCNAEANWCLVQHDAVQGWAPRDTLPVAKPAPAASSAPSNPATADGVVKSVRDAARSLVAVPGSSLPASSPVPAATGGASTGGVAGTGLSVH